MCPRVCRCVLLLSLLACEFPQPFLFSPRVFLSVSIAQVSVGTRQTWSVDTKRSVKTSSRRRSPRLSWSSCGRPYRTSHSSSWRPPPSSPSVSLSTSLPEKKANVRTGADGGGEDGLGGCQRKAGGKTKCFRCEAGREKQ